MPFPVEKAPSQRIIAKKGPHNKGVIVSQLFYYPVQGLVFEGGNTIRDLSDVVASSCICLQNNNIPFNILISDCGKKIFLFPQVLFFLITAFSEIIFLVAWWVFKHIVTLQIKRKDSESCS